MESGFRLQPKLRQRHLAIYAQGKDLNAWKNSSGCAWLQRCSQGNPLAQRYTCSIYYPLLGSKASNVLKFEFVVLSEIRMF